MSTQNRAINKATENAGLRLVKEIVTEMWYSDFQEFDRENDDGVDGFINLRIKGVDTGGVVYVQIKSGSAYKKIIKKRPNFIGIQLGEKHISDHKDRWFRKELPVILIYVDKTKAYWVDLKSEEAYCSENKQIILIPKHQTFNCHSKGELLRLSGVKSLSYFLPTLDMSREEISFLGLSEPIKSGARKYYKNWIKSEQIEKVNPYFGEITINRVGWRHITRPGRKTERIIQSWLLLSVAKKIIKEVSHFHRLGRATIKKYGRYEYKNYEACVKLVDYIGLRAKINFPHRDSAVIQVVLRRKRIISQESSTVLDNQIWFYSVYEKRVIYS